MRRKKAEGASRLEPGKACMAGPPPTQAILMTFVYYSHCTHTGGRERAVRSSAAGGRLPSWLTSMPALRSCKFSAVTWHRAQEGLPCIPAGSVLPATCLDGCVLGGVLDLKV